jgi:hypothetical protein
MMPRYNLKKMLAEIEEDRGVKRKKDLRLSRASLKKMVEERQRLMRGRDRGQ